MLFLNWGTRSLETLQWLLEKRAVNCKLELKNSAVNCEMTNRLIEQNHEMCKGRVTVFLRMALRCFNNEFLYRADNGLRTQIGYCLAKDTKFHPRPTFHIVLTTPFKIQNK